MSIQRREVCELGKGWEWIIVDSANHEIVSGGKIMSKLLDQILLVDDEQAILDALVRQHRKLYNLETACGPEEGLKAIAERGPFIAVVTDFQMPGMNGIEFLTEVREIAPDMVRMMLTGQADLQTAVHAVNRGHIFRFLTKPCEAELFRSCLDAAIENYRLRHAEQDLLEQTVRGSIEVLVDVLSLADPAAFGKATRIRNIIRQIVGHLKLTDGWQYETAALLSQLGCVAIPEDVIERMAHGETLSPDQIAMMDHHPKLARDILKKIPRLQTVADIVYCQRPEGRDECSSQDGVAAIGGRMLAAALEFEELLGIGASPEKALASLQKESDKYDKGVLDALALVEIAKPGNVTRVVPLAQLRLGMTLQEDVLNTDGNLIVGTGHELSQGSLQRLRNYAELGRLAKVEFRVQLSQESACSREKLIV